MTRRAFIWNRLKRRLASELVAAAVNRLSEKRWIEPLTAVASDCQIDRAPCAVDPAGDM